ncbi:hypothetical protein [Amycolatopsis sp. NPDC004625]|uniref:hypothetical protein n=1 Tax=Amycolatopsis sp. NPDC004625 TaxID=3154670 RepID=UPI0033B747D3
MTTYQLVPYLMSVAVHGSPTDIRPTKDIDGNGFHVLDALAKIFAASRGILFRDPDDQNRHLIISKLHRGKEAIFVEIQPGRSGIKSEIRKADGTRMSRDEVDTEFTPVRHCYYCPPGGHHVIVIAERVGLAGATTMSYTLLSKTFEKYFDGLKLNNLPAMTEDLLRKSVEEQPVKALVFKRPRAGEGSDKLIMVSNESVEVEVRLTPRRRKFWTSKSLPQGTEDRPTRESLLGVLVPVLKPGVQEDDAVKALLDEGWESSLAVKMPGGTQRLVNVHSSRAVSMSFPIVSETDDGATASRPSDDEFKAGCVEILELLSGQYGLTDRSAGQCKWDTHEWNDASAEPWEVVWDEPNGSATSRT